MARRARGSSRCSNGEGVCDFWRKGAGEDPFVIMVRFLPTFAAVIEGGTV